MRAPFFVYRMYRICFKCILKSVSTDETTAWGHRADIETRSLPTGETPRQLYTNKPAVLSSLDENNRLFFADNAAFNSEENKAEREADESDREARGRDGGNLRTLVRDLRDFNHGGVHLDGAAADRLARNLAGAIQRRNETSGTRKVSHEITRFHARTRKHESIPRDNQSTKRGAARESTSTRARLERDAYAPDHRRRGDSLGRGESRSSVKENETKETPSSVTAIARNPDRWFHQSTKPIFTRWRADPLAPLERIGLLPVRSRARRRDATMGTMKTRCDATERNSTHPSIHPSIHRRRRVARRRRRRDERRSSIHASAHASAHERVPPGG